MGLLAGCCSSPSRQFLAICGNVNTMKKINSNPHSLSYIRFLNLARAVRELPSFPSLDAIEEQLLNAFASIWNKGQTVRVLEAMDLFPDVSGSTVHRRLVSLRKKGMIALSIDENNQRVKYIVHTPLANRYFAKLGECLGKAARA
jgi:hypothetical protein